MNSHALRLCAAAAAALLAGAPLAAQPTVRLPAADRPLAGRATPLFSIGAEEGESWEMLSNVSQVTFDRNDNLYVLDEGNKRVLVFDRAGRFVRQLGKRGSGPGEFEIPVGMAVQPDGGLAVVDLAHRSISIFGADGVFRRTVPWSEEWGMAGTRIAAHPQGGLVGPLRPSPRIDAGVGVSTAPRKLTFTRVGLAGNGAATRLFEIPDPSTVTSEASQNGNERRVRMTMARPPEFSPLTLWGVLPDGGTALSHTALYTVKVQDAAGRTVRFLQRPVPVRAPTQADRDRAKERAREAIRSGRGLRVVTIGGGRAGGPSEAQMRERLERDLDNMQFADTVRALQGLTVAPSGKLWIERTPRDIGEPGPIDVVTPQGQYLGTISGERLPAAISPAGRAVYIDRDDMGVERVIVRQLPAAWR